MSDQPLGPLTDHEYDGIREFDNPTPGWWYAIFWATVLFSVAYFMFFQFSPAAWSVEEAYESAVAANLRKQFAEIGDLEPKQATIVKCMHDEKWLSVGRTVFKAQCVSCHGDKGQGLVGPNLTDEYWKNLKSITGIAEVLQEGAANGAMPAWQNRLHPNEIVLVSSYVASLRGKNLTGPRGPEGEKIPPWPTVNEVQESP